MSIQAMKQALEALECLFGIPEQFTGKGGGDVAVWTLGGSYRAQQAIPVLRQAIEQAEKQVVFKIYKPTPPRLAIPNVNDAELPWMYDQDPSSGNVASMWVTPVKATPQPQQEPLRLWLWKNFVDGKPEYWAFNNPFPCISVEGDPLTLGEPCGWAFLKPSVNGRPHRSEQEVINTVTRLATTPQPQREWVGLTDEEITECFKITPDQYLPWQIYRRIEAKLKEKNT